MRFANGCAYYQTFTDFYAMAVYLYGTGVRLYDLHLECGGDGYTASFDDCADSDSFYGETVGAEACATSGSQ